MKKLILSVMLTIGWVLALNAQPSSHPKWIDNPPTPKKGNFYYRVTMAEGRDYNSAYSKAFAMAVYESYSRLKGIAVSVNASEDDIEKKVTDAITTVSGGQMQLPLNKVCEYEEKTTSSMGVRLYVLWQVANNALDDPQFENFNKCR